MRVHGLVSDTIYFEADARQDREPVKFLAKVFTSGVLTPIKTVNVLSS